MVEGAANPEVDSPSASACFLALFPLPLLALAIGGPYTGLIACAARPCGVASAVPEAGLVTDMDLAGAEYVSEFGQHVGGWVIHLPVVVCTNSPSTTTSVVRPATRAG